MLLIQQMELLLQPSVLGKSITLRPCDLRPFVHHRAEEFECFARLIRRRSAPVAQRAVKELDCSERAVFAFNM
jgi:hypothetical protein